MSNIISQRSEILFLYDVKQCNPNGDPMDANRPRMDEETGHCLVTDVRLKRTVRDYLFLQGFNGTKGSLGDIFIRDKSPEDADPGDGTPHTGQSRSKDYSGKDDFLTKFIDVRLFGGVSAPKKETGNKAKGKAKAEKSADDEATGEDGGAEEKTDEKKTFHFTGPVQFGMGRSLHPVKENFIKGTGAFATKEGSQQKTFREEYNITYGMIGFHGVVNENAAKLVKTTEEDVQFLTKGLWFGTKELLTRSKKGHMPRLLVKIDYSEKGFFIGELVERLSVKTKEDKPFDAVEDVADVTVDVSQLNAVLKKYADKIAKITVEKDERLQLSEPIFTK
jgi:CRISPR-associated protein Csh2